MRMKKDIQFDASSELERTETQAADSVVLSEAASTVEQKAKEAGHRIPQRAVDSIAKYMIGVGTIFCCGRNTHIYTPTAK